MSAASVIAVASLMVAGAGAWGFFHVRERWRNRMAASHAMLCFDWPPRIRLQRVERLKWTKPARAEARVAALRLLGFEPLEGCRVAENGMGRRMLVLHQPAWGMIALVQEEDSVGTWTDVVWFDAVRVSTTCASSAVKRKHFYLSAGGPDIHLPAAGEIEVVEAVRRAGGNDLEPREFTMDTAVAAIEEAYARSADEHLLRSIDVTELRRMLKSCGGDDDEELDERLLQRALSVLPYVVADKLREACRAQFMRETALSAREWHEARGRLLVLHDRTPLVELAARKIRGVLRASEACCTTALRKRFKRLKPTDSSPRSQFAELNQTLPAWERYARLGQVTRPVPADIYCAPVDRPAT